VGGAPASRSASTGSSWLVMLCIGGSRTEDVL